MFRKIKVSFYRHNAAISNVDCRCLEKCNLSIGGSEYALLS